MKKTHDLVATVGEYQKDGETKKRYMNCGVVLTDEETGRLSIKLGALPVGEDAQYWSGWLSLYEVDRDRQQRQSPSQHQQQKQDGYQQQPDRSVANDPPQDDIPF